MNIDERNHIDVGLGKIFLTNPPGVLVSIGIGSCVVLCLYHRATKTAGMAHIMLPESNERFILFDRPAKYAEPAVENLLERFSKMGIRNHHSLTAKIIGGAQLFLFKQVPNIGAKNIEVVKKALEEHRIPLKSESVGGNYGRSVWFFSDTGKVLVRNKLREIIEI